MRQGIGASTAGQRLKWYRCYNDVAASLQWFTVQQSRVTVDLKNRLCNLNIRLVSSPVDQSDAPISTTFPTSLSSFDLRLADIHRIYSVHAFHHAHNPEIYIIWVSKDRKTEGNRADLELYLMLVVTREAAQGATILPRNQDIVLAAHVQDLGSLHQVLVVECCFRVPCLPCESLNLSLRWLVRCFLVELEICLRRGDDAVSGRKTSASCQSVRYTSVQRMLSRTNG